MTLLVLQACLLLCRNIMLLNSFKSLYYCLHLQILSCNFFTWLNTFHHTFLNFKDYIRIIFLISSRWLNRIENTFFKLLSVSWRFILHNTFHCSIVDLVPTKSKITLLKRLHLILDLWLTFLKLWLPPFDIMLRRMKGLRIKSCMEFTVSISSRSGLVLWFTLTLWFPF